MKLVLYLLHLLVPNLLVEAKLDIMEVSATQLTFREGLFDPEHKWFEWKILRK